MDYAKVGQSEYKHAKEEKKYYFLENEEPKEGNKLPTFHQIFENMQKNGGIISNASLYNGMLYFSSLDTYVYAVDAETGKLTWKFKTGGPVTFCAPLIHNEKIYFGSNDEYFYCLDLAGSIIWKKHLGDVIASTALGIGDCIFVSNGSGYLFCFTEGGIEKWRFKMGEGSTVAPSAVNGKIFVGSFDKHVYALDIEGKLLWKFLAGERIGPPLIMDNGRKIVSNTDISFYKMPEAIAPILLCPSYDNYLYALDENGNFLWKYNCGSSISNGGLGCGNGSIYAGCVNGYLHAIDLSGRKKWTFRSNGMIGRGAEFVDGKIYFASCDQKIYCLTEEGNKIWEFLTGGSNISKPLIIDEKIFFGSTDSFFYCLNAKNRTVEWKYKVGSGSESSSDVSQIVNAFVEHDKKIFKVWVPETLKGKTQAGGFLTGYGMPEGFSFGGEEVYKPSSGAYKNDLNYFEKKKPYKK